MKKLNWLLVILMCLVGTVSAYAQGQSPAGKPAVPSARSAGGYAQGWDAAIFRNAQGPFLNNCKLSCRASIQSDPKLGPQASRLNTSGFCESYCNCSLNAISKRVPYSSFAAYGLGRASAQTKQTIDGIVAECGKKYLNTLTGN